MKRPLTLLALAAVITSPAFAAIEGTQGSESEGSFDIELTIEAEQTGTQIKVTGFEDLKFTTTPGVVPGEQEMTLCVTSPDPSVKYNVTVEADPLQFGENNEVVTYEVEFGDSDNILLLAVGAQSASINSEGHPYATSTGQDCDSDTTGLIRNATRFISDNFPSVTGTGNTTVTVTVTPD